LNTLPTLRSNFLSGFEALRIDDPRIRRVKTTMGSGPRRLAGGKRV